MTPKCHPEISGYGIEYCWGYSKLRFCKEFNDTVAANLERNVRNALNINVITKSQSDKFVQKAIDYKITYLYLLHKIEKANTSKTGMTKSTTLHAQIKKIVKMFKQH